MRSRWSDSLGNKLEGLEALLYATRLIGEETNLVLWGGGNSSAKFPAKDHLGREIRVLSVKGSGSDMKTITAGQFTPLRLDELLPLLGRDEMTDEEMVAYQNRCVVEPGAPRPSIETLLHAFLPETYIFHTHADAICTLTDTSDSTKFIRQVFGEEVGRVSPSPSPLPVELLPGTPRGRGMRRGGWRRALAARLTDCSGFGRVAGSRRRRSSRRRSSWRKSSRVIVWPPQSSALPRWPRNWG